jgi:hypothetical protein
MQGGWARQAGGNFYIFYSVEYAVSSCKSHRWLSTSLSLVCRDELECIWLEYGSPFNLPSHSGVSIDWKVVYDVKSQLPNTFLSETFVTAPGVALH